MSAENSSRVQFDDRPALEELERLQRSIQEYRRKREQAEGEFEQFVGTFKASANVTAAPRPSGDSAISPMKPVVVPAASAAGPAASVATPMAPDQPMMAATGGRPPQVTVPAGFFTEAPRPVAFDDEPPVASEVLAGKARGRMPLMLGAGAVLILAAFLLTRASFSPAPSSPAASAAEPAASPAADPAAGATSGPPPTPAPASPAPGQAVIPAPAPSSTTPAPPAEVRTLRRVWVRVVVDGNRTVEREVEANASIPLPAGRTFVIRAGDAGAVRFFLNGHDQGPLGGEAQVVTRTFTSAAPSAPVRAR